MIDSIGKAALALGLAVSAAACGVRTVTSDINPRISRQPTCDEAVVVYASRNDVPMDYYELGWISAEANSVYTSNGQIQTQIKKKAAEVGANGIIANPVQEAKVAVKVLGEALGSQSATKKATALAIYMPADSARVVSQCGHG
ncbi:MAG: hypothetical protein ABI681_04655 [Gemmatimonadales bacterium]